MSKRKRRYRSKKAKKKFNLVLGSILFLFLIGVAFSFGVLFGFGFVLGFGLSVYNGTLEKKPSLPIFLFLGGLIIRFALSFIPSVLESKSVVGLFISGSLFVVLLVYGLRVKKGQWKFWRKKR